MIRKVIFNKITFKNFNDNDFNEIILSKGYFVFPAAPALVNIKYEKYYHNSLIRADHVFFDSGFFVILLRIFKNISVKKFSGFKFLKLFFNYLKNNNNNIILSVDPNKKSLNINNAYFRKLGLTKVFNYKAKNYKGKKILDKELLNLIKKIKPNFIIINIGGGKQEILASYLKENLKKKQTIICTGAAISFFTGDKEPINSQIDRLYLGWFIRLLYNPSIFLKRYLKALELISMVLTNRINVN